MPDQIVPQAQPITPGGEAEWFPPAEDDTITAAPPPSQKRDIRWVFFGKDGLRAGWSVLLFMLFAAAISALARTALSHTVPSSKSLMAGSHEMPVSVTLIGEWVAFAVFALAAFLVSLVERRGFGRFGLGALSSRRIVQFLVGAAWGLLALTLLVVVLHMTGVLAWNGVLLHGAETVKWGALWFLAFLGVGCMEEFLTRGFLQFTLARGLAGIAGALGRSERSRKLFGFWAAALFFSLLFGLGHKNNPGESPIGLVSAGLIGLVFAFSLWRTGSLWWAVGYHAAWDWAQSFVWGVPDSGGMMQHHLLATQPQGKLLLSGGLTGPEGSVWVLPIILITAAVIAVTLKAEPGSPAMEASEAHLPAR